MKFWKKKKEIKDTEDSSIFEHPRYKENPMNILFANFILDTIGELSKDKYEQIDKMNLAKVFKTPDMEWKQIVKRVLNLSDTIDIAILDLWYRNREIAEKQGVDYHPIQFAMDFVDNYYKEDSKVDVWENDNLEQAKRRIETYRMGK